MAARTNCPRTLASTHGNLNTLMIGTEAGLLLNESRKAVTAVKNRDELKHEVENREGENYQITRATPPLRMVVPQYYWKLGGPANALITGRSAYPSASAKSSRNFSDTETSQYQVFNIMAKTDSLQGSLDLLVLKILSRRPRLHGYAIMSAIKESSGDVLRADEGSLYPALHRMEENRWIRAEWITKDTGRRARIYELTAAGKKQLADEESRWHAVTSAVNRVLRTV